MHCQYHLPGFFAELDCLLSVEPRHCEHRGATEAPLWALAEEEVVEPTRAAASASASAAAGKVGMPPPLPPPPSAMYLVSLATWRLDRESSFIAVGFLASAMFLNTHTSK